jgi:ketosteroid isomerase-like protein
VQTKISKMTIQEIATRLVELCRKGQFETAQKELYAEDAVSIEQQGSPAFAKETKGLQAILEKGRLWEAMVEETHGLTVSEPLIAGNRLAIAMTFDVTMKERGHNVFKEIIVYDVKEGKIISEQFFN